jgi:hypothetical protein
MVMMMMIEEIKRYCLFLVLLFFPLTVFAQDNDFGIWYGASVNKNIIKRLEIDATAMVRTFENAGKVEQGYIEAGLEYKFTGFLSAAASYRLTDKYEEDLDKYLYQHKIFVDLKGNLKVADFVFACRVRFQTRIKTYDNKNDFTDYTGRIKLKATYKTPSFPVNPYLYAETFLPLSKDADKNVEKNRFATGIEYSIAKKHSVELEYIFEHNYLPVKSAHDNHIISINYNLKF